MYSPKRRRLPLAGLGLIGAGGVLGVALTMPGAAYGDPGQEASTSSGPQQRSSESAKGSTRKVAGSMTVSITGVDRAAAGGVAGPRSAAVGVARVGARLDRAVAEGRLTREQADTILAAAEAGLLNGDLVNGPGGHHGPGIDRQDR